MTRRLPLLSLLVVAALASTAVPAAAIPASVTLQVADGSLTYGETFQLSGTVSPAEPGVTVEIVDAAETVLTSAAADATTGAYSATLPATASVTVHARIQGAPAVFSSDVPLTVATAVTSALRDVRLFDMATVSGTVQPVHEGSVTVTLYRGSTVAEQRAVPLSGGAFETKVRIEKPGTYRAVVDIPADADHAAGSGTTADKETPLPKLRTGSKGIHVLLLEKRLRALGYYLPGADRRYDSRTGDIVVAWHKVQGRARTRTITAADWRRLADPRIPKPRSKSPRFHIEVDQTKQALYVVKGGVIRWILPASTGGPGVGTTYDGTYRFWLRFPGYSPKRLYYPSFFHEGRAIHGWPDVPPTAASHGCVRIPMWAAVWMYEQLSVGGVIKIYHS